MVAIFILAITVSLAIPNQPPVQSNRIAKMRLLSLLAGTWELRARMMPANGKPMDEHGTIKCQFLFDSTYLECNAKLTNTRGTTRSYKQFVTYNLDSAQYELLYLYSGTPARIEERGQLTSNGLTTKGSYRLPDGRREHIATAMTWTDKNSLHYESRSSATLWEVDYTCSFTRLGK